MSDNWEKLNAIEQPDPLFGSIPLDDPELRELVEAARELGQLGSGTWRRVVAAREALTKKYPSLGGSE